MKPMSENELEKVQPSFLWRRPLSYRRSHENGKWLFAFDIISLGEKIGFGMIFASFGTLIAFGVRHEWPLYATLLPTLVVGIAAVVQRTNRSARFRNCQLAVSDGQCLVVDRGSPLELPRLTGVRLVKRYRDRDGRDILDGDSELYLVVDGGEPSKKYYPLADSGMLRDLDGLARDIVRSADGLKLEEVYIK